MIDHVWTVLCSDAIIDRESNNITLFRVVEQVTISDAPLPILVPLEYRIVSLWSRSDPEVGAKGSGRVKLISPSGTEVAHMEHDVDLTEATRIRTIGQFSGLPVHEFGLHYFLVEFRLGNTEEWKQVARIPLTVDHTRSAE